MLTLKCLIIVVTTGIKPRSIGLKVASALVQVGAKPRFIPVGKLTPAYRAGAPTTYGRWMCPEQWVIAIARAAGVQKIQTLQK